MARTPARVHRNQADRTAETRRRILDAVVACIEEEGFARASSQRIARRAGVSVGAVQHHFMSKTDILRAVLEESYGDLSSAFEGVSVEGASLEERVSLFVDRAWGHYADPRFRSTLEILLSTRGDLAEPGGHGGDRVTSPIAESAARARRLWDSFFSDLDVSPQTQRDLLRFAFVNLAGLSMTARFERSSVRTLRQVGLVKTALTALLRDAAAR